MIRTAILAAFIALAGTPAQAATAYLVSCTSSSSATGKLIYVGVYNHAGATLTFTFSTYCPYSVELE